MRKLFSIILIVLLLLNTMGYYGVFVGMQLQNNLDMIAKLDADDYQNEEAITIKFPISVPYTSDSRGYERVNGQFEHNGEFYRLVKQRLTSDTLYIVCVRDQQSKDIHEALTSYVKTFTDKPADSHSKSPTINFGKDYVLPVFSMDHLSSGWSVDVVKQTSIFILNPTFYPSITLPPERAQFS